MAVLGLALAVWSVWSHVGLRKARAEARHSARVLDRLVSSISHEMRTPMTGIVGMTSLLEGTEPTPRQRRYLANLRRSNEALLEIIDDIADLGKLESGRLELDENAFDLRASIEEALAKLAPMAHRKGLEIGYWIDNGTPETLISDEPRIQRILTTLLSNGIKLTSAGEVVVEVSATGEAEGNRQQITLSVRDSGTGWRPEDVEKLLDPFSHQDSDLSRRYGGVGLSLAAGRRLAERMGGNLWLAESTGSGSRFCFSIRAGAAPGPDRSNLYRPHSMLLDQRILIVHANTEIGKMLRRQVELVGMKPHVVTTAAEALTQLAGAVPQFDGGRVSFDLAIVDQRTVATDGLGWEERLRQELDDRYVPALYLMPIETDDDTLEDERSTGRCLATPIRAFDLIDALVALTSVEVHDSPRLIAKTG